MTSDRFLTNESIIEKTYSSKIFLPIGAQNCLGTVGQGFSPAFSGTKAPRWRDPTKQFACQTKGNKGNLASHGSTIMNRLIMKCYAIDG